MVTFQVIDILTDDGVYYILRIENDRLVVADVPLSEKAISNFSAELPNEILNYLEEKNISY